MKAFVSGTAAVILIAIAAAIILDAMGLTAADLYSTSNVRL